MASMVEQVGAALVAMAESSEVDGTPSWRAAGDTDSWDGVPLDLGLEHAETTGLETTKLSCPCEE